MNVETFLRQNTALLAEAGIGSARLDCLVLLEDATGKDRSWLLAHPEHKLPDNITSILNKNIMRRAEHIPLAYIRGWTEFYGRRFAVDDHVLEPRPESETMIDLFKELDLSETATIIDVGTGSGALAITAALERPRSRVIATDIDDSCLAVARRNNERFAAGVSFYKADLLAGIDTADIILANLPYVPDGYAINQAAMNEPRLAIFGGPDGMDLYRRMFKQIDDMQHKPRFILAESLPPHHGTLAQIASSHGYQQFREQDFIQVFNPI